MPAQAQQAKVRFIDGAPLLETLIGGVLQGLGSDVYLQVDSQTVASSFTYGSMTTFLPTPAGVHSLTARNTEGYAVGPLKTTALAAGKRYTLVLVGSYPNYKVLTFEEPAASDEAGISLYEASPSVPDAAFGSYTVSTNSDFKQLGTAHFGDVVTVSLGKSVTDTGGYVGAASKPLGAIAPSQVNTFDTDNALPFHKAARLSLFLFDPASGSGSTTGPVFGSLDQ